MEVIFTVQFLERVEECTDYIALDHIPTAVKWARGVFEHCQEEGRQMAEFRSIKAIANVSRASNNIPVSI